MQIRIRGKGPRGFYGILGYFDLTISIYREWRGDLPGHPTYRFVTFGLRSPLIRHSGRAFKDKRARWRWYRVRFGFGCGNVYLGPIFILTTFGHSHPPLRYRTAGPLEWARQPSMAEHLAESRRS